MDPRIKRLRFPLAAVLAAMLLLQIAIPGVAGRLADPQRDTFPNSPQNLDQRRADAPAQLEDAATATPSGSPQPTNTLPPSALPGRATATNIPIIRIASSLQPALLAFIDVPPGPVNQPYVILSAYRSVPAAAPPEIRGIINSVEFICSTTPCTLPVSSSSRITFHAHNQYGETSEDVQATIRAEKQADGYHVSIDTLSQFFTFSDACAGMWKISDTNAQTIWSTFPQSPDQLNTNLRLHYLAGQLITSGVVDAKDCPGGGMNNGAPNACGLERSHDAMINWQNQFDFNIWLTAKDYRLPPRVVKTLIEIESQFWPFNSRSYLDEFGLGQISQLGMDVLLRQNPGLYAQVCPGVLADCTVPYSVLTPAMQAMIRGALLNSLNSECPTCPNGIDIGIAKQSLTLMALLLRANCQQTKQILDEYDETASYEDYWKFTLVSYHGGGDCLSEAVKEVSDAGEDMDWRHVSRRLNCSAGGYVNRFWDALTTFDQNRLKPGEVSQPTSAPTFLPTPTPLPTIGPPPSHAQVWVIVILDTNNDGVAEPSEWVSNVPVTLTLPNGSQINGTTVNGKAQFDMTGYTTGTQITVSLPALYRQDTLRLPETGVVPVVFVFQSVIPTPLPQ